MRWRRLKGHSEGYSLPVITALEGLVGPARGGPRGALPTVAEGVSHGEFALSWRHFMRLEVPRPASDGVGKAIALEHLSVMISIRGVTGYLAAQRAG